MWSTIKQQFSVWGHGGSGVGVTLKVRLHGFVMGETRGGESVSHVGVGVTLEVRLHRLVMGENGPRESGKILGWVTRGEESESGVGVGVTLEVGLHRLKKS